MFGWTADEPRSRAVLDAYTEAGGNFVDTANSYLVEHGRSETIIGRWLADRGNRDQIVVATKVGGGRGPVRSLRAETIKREAHASLERLQTDRIDLYYAHFDDEQTPLEESLRAFDALVQAGVVRHLGASNYTPARLTAALEFQREHGLAEFTVLQPHYNLVERAFERTLLPVADAWDLAVLPYFALAKGFLTGKYRPDAAGAGAEWEHVARLHEVGGGGVRVGEQPDGARAVRGGDAGRDTRPGVDRDGERGAVGLGVHGHHLVEMEPVGVLAGHRDAQEATAFAHGEGHELRGRECRREDEVALVLPVRVVDDHDRAAGGDLGDGAVHPACGVSLQGAPSPSSCR